MSSKEPYFCGYEFIHNRAFGHMWEWAEPVKHDGTNYLPKNWKMLIHDKNGKLVYYEWCEDNSVAALMAHICNAQNARNLCGLRMYWD